MTSGQMKGYGSTEVVEINKEIPPLHDPFQGKLLIRVKAAGINPIDWKIREGY
jgi:NADPH:quinone reductase-like Zn-dependent oxidoreductase